MKENRYFWQIFGQPCCDISIQSGTPFTNKGWLPYQHRKVVTYQLRIKWYTFSIPNFNGFNIEVWKWKSYFIPHSMMNVLTSTQALHMFYFFCLYRRGLHSIGLWVCRRQNKLYSNTNRVSWSSFMQPLIIRISVIIIIMTIHIMISHGDNIHIFAWDIYGTMSPYAVRRLNAFLSESWAGYQIWTGGSII